jgi:putative glutamine amidotransferase
MSTTSAPPAGRRPLVGLPADTYEQKGLLFHSIGDKYLRAVADVSKATPVMIPAMDLEADLDGLLDRLDGVVMTGAVSNVHPPHYGAVATERHEPFDHARDALTLKLIATVIARGMPLLCICRGFQELNVVMGGTLDTEIQDMDGRLDHRGKSPDLDVRYGPAHPIAVRKGGVLARILGKEETVVNTVHRQGVARLAPGLVSEAHAPDGVVEAVSVKDAAGFTLGMQWHPEYKAAANPDSVKIFEAFGKACREYAAGHGTVRKAS